MKNNLPYLIIFIVFFHTNVNVYFPSKANKYSLLIVGNFQCFRVKIAFRTQVENDDDGINFITILY